jgi:MFS family permease
LATLREAVDTDPVLHELAQTPLMLSIMSLAYQGVAGDEFATQEGDSEERRKQIFGLYVEQMFHRKGMTSPVFRKEKIIGWLSWLAGQMRKHSQSDFLVEGLQPSWSGTKTKRAAYGTAVAFSLGLLFGLICPLKVGLSDSLGVGLSILVGVGLGCWSASPLRRCIISGSIGGLIFELIFRCSESRMVTSGLLESGLVNGLVNGLANGLLCGLVGGLGVGSLIHINLVETLSWNWNRFWKNAIFGLIVGLIVALILALIILLFFGLRFGVSDPLRFGLIVGLPLGLSFGPIGGLFMGLVGGFTDRVKEGKASPNQGIKLSLQNSLALFLVTGLIFDDPAYCRAERLAEPRAELLAEGRAEPRAYRRTDRWVKSRRFSRDQALCVTTDSLVERIYTI